MSADADFHTTRWSVVLAAGRGESPSARDALERLCAAYWYPLYAFARRRGAAAEDAADAVQGLFASLLERRDLAAADPRRGRFRAFLRTALRNHMANEHDRAQARKRGGGATTLSLDLDDAEGRYRLEPPDAETPERAFERAWARTVIERALATVEADYARRERADWYAALGPALGGDEVAPYAAIAARLGASEGAVKAEAHRLRAAFRERLRREVAETLADPAGVEDELVELRAALAGGNPPGSP